MATTVKKLYELLAVRANLKGQADACRSDLLNTFEKKVLHFAKRLVTFKPIAEEGIQRTEEQLEMQTTVRRELEWLTGIWEGAMDVAFQCDTGNQQSKSDVVLADGTILLAQVPGSALLELEKRVNEALTLIKGIPTLDPAKGFTLATDQANTGVHVARPVERIRTQKVQEPLVLLQPTKEHPGKAEVISKDVPIGTILTQEWSGLLTVGEKGDMLERGEMLLRAVKQAVTRSTQVDVDVTKKIGRTVLGYLFRGEKPTV